MEITWSSNQNILRGSGHNTQKVLKLRNLIRQQKNIEVIGDDKFKKLYSQSTFLF